MEASSTHYSKSLFRLILVCSLAKILLSGLLELGNDEVYYWTYALQLDWNHFDHPPMVGLLIRIFSIDLHWVSEVSLRLGSVISAAISTWFVFLTTQKLATERAGFFAAILYQFSVYTGIIAGLFILPDSPQMPFWTASLYLMTGLLTGDKDGKQTMLWILLGITIGLAALSKVHGLYLWVGFGSSILLLRPKWLLNGRLYLGILLTVCCLLPILYWNIHYDFITYRFHSERVTHTRIEWEMLGREILGEFAYQNPVIYILMIIAVIAFIRGRFQLDKKGMATWIFLMSIPMILLFWAIALFNPTLPHWTGPAFIPLYILSSIYLDKANQKGIPLLLKSAMILLSLVLVIGIAIIRFAPVNFGSHEKQNYGEYCPTLDLTGWKDFSIAFDQLAKADMAAGKIKSNACIMVSNWFPGGHLEFYTSRKSGLPLVGIGRLQDLHKFAWLNQERAPLQLGADAYCVVPSNLPLDVKAVYGNLFEEIQDPVIINQVRNGGIVRYFYVYRLRHCISIPIESIPR